VSLTKCKRLFPIKETDYSTSKPCIEVKGTLIQALGAFKELRCLDTLYKLLESDDEKVMFSACEALSFYHELPVKSKRSIVERLIKRYNAVWSKDCIRYFKNNISSWKNASNQQERKFNKFKPFDRALRKLVGCPEGLPFATKTDSPLPLPFTFNIGPELWLRLFKEHKNDATW
ncbi:MAG: HEAT repeat domain-containing protein, partial [Planctomycetota bacterium]